MDQRAEQPSGHRVKQHEAFPKLLRLRRRGGGQLGQLLLQLPFQKRIDRRGQSRRGAQHAPEAVPRQLGAAARAV